VQQTAKKYTDVLGVTWRFGEFKPTNIIMHDKPVTGETVCKWAMGNLGDIQLELLQPVSGPSTWMEYLNKDGEGIHHIRFGFLDPATYDPIIAGFKKAGYGIEMLGVLGTSEFSYMATRNDLGIIFEFVKRNVPAAAPAAPGPGFVAPTYLPAPLLDMKDKRVTQVGIIVKDRDASSKKYLDLFGSTLNARVFSVNTIVMHDQPMKEDAVANAALGNLGGRQIELIQPVSGPSTWAEFLKQHGPGAHHFSFSSVETGDSIMQALKDAGYGVEMQALMGEPPKLAPSGGYSFAYIATQKDLATILEYVKTRRQRDPVMTPTP
jgi:methylmalonyl-CoA/ethylmalonyl-CoA epimerase